MAGNKKQANKGRRPKFFVGRRRIRLQNLPRRIPAWELSRGRALRVALEKFACGERKGKRIRGRMLGGRHQPGAGICQVRQSRAIVSSAAPKEFCRKVSSASGNTFHGRCAPAPAIMFGGLDAPQSVNRAMRGGSFRFCVGHGHPFTGERTSLRENSAVKGGARARELKPGVPTSCRTACGKKKLRSESRSGYVPPSQGTAMTHQIRIRKRRKLLCGAAGLALFVNLPKLA